MSPRRSRNKLKAFAPTIIVIVTLYLLSKLIPENEIEKFISESGSLAPLTYILISLLSYIIAPLSGTPIAFVGFHLFGSDVVYYHAISAFISFSTNYWISRKWGRGVVTKLAGEESLVKIDKFIENKGYVSLFLIRVFLTTYHDFISYAFGFTKMRYVPYIIISTVGLLPGYGIWYWAATQATSAVAFTVHTILIAGLFIGIYWVWTKYLKVR